MLRYLIEPIINDDEDINKSFSLNTKNYFQLNSIKYYKKISWFVILKNSIKKSTEKITR